MMLNARNDDNLNVKQDVFITNQAYSAGNFIIVKGCNGLTGAGRTPKVKITGPITPSATK